MERIYYKQTNKFQFVLDFLRFQLAKSVMDLRVMMDIEEEERKMLRKVKMMMMMMMSRGGYRGGGHGGTCPPPPKFLKQIRKS